MLKATHNSINSSPLAQQRMRVLIVDDHPLVRRGLAETISEEPDMVVCGEACDTTEAMRLVEATQPNVVIVDLSLKTGHGIDLIEQVHARDGQVKMLVSSVHDEALFAERVLRAGAVGYINKQEPIEKIVGAIRQAMRGEIAISPRMQNRLLQSVVGGDSLAQDPIQGLSNRELEVFDMIGHGMSTKQIAGKLHLSHKTIETHREKIKTKLNLSNANELAHRATQWVLERH